MMIIMKDNPVIIEIDSQFCPFQREDLYNQLTKGLCPDLTPGLEGVDV